MTTYTVFRRHPDGYVNAIAGDTHTLTNGNHGTIGGERVSFEILHTGTDWADVRRFIEDTRAADHDGVTHPTGA